MDKETALALEASIKHWEENKDATAPWRASVTADSCPLCLHIDVNKHGCYKCPVMLRTGESDCEGSPWNEAWHARQNWHEQQTAAARERFRLAAQAEVDFLKSLREES